MADRNPFAVPSDLPFAFPPFDAIRHEHYRPAFDARCRRAARRGRGDRRRPGAADLREHRRGAGALRADLLARVMRVFDNLAASMATPEMQALEAELAPLVAEHTDAIRLDPRLFARIDAVHAARHDAGLDARAGAARRALPPRLRARRCRARRGRPRHAAGAQRADHLADHRVRHTACWPSPTTSRCTSPTAAELDGLSANAVEAAATPRVRRGSRATCSPCRCPPASRRCPR